MRAVKAFIRRHIDQGTFIPMLGLVALIIVLGLLAVGCAPIPHGDDVHYYGSASGGPTYHAPPPPVYYAPPPPPRIYREWREWRTYPPGPNYGWSGT
jgi:hypothetical protein